jgi:hypothetical protein
MTQGLVNGLVFGGEVQFQPSAVSAFGTLETNDLTPVFQGDFVYGLNTQLWNTANVTGTGASVDTNSSRLRIQCGTSSGGYAFVTSKRLLRYRAGQGSVVRMTPIFSTGTANNLQLMGIGTMNVNGTPLDGYFFGFNGTTFGVVHYNRSTGTWYNQTAWNGDKCLSGDGSFVYDPTKGTPAMIKYPYLGFGDIEFFLQNPDDAQWKLVHTVRYANTTNTTQLSNPTMQFLGYSANTGGTVNRTLYCGSVGVFVSGQRSFVGNPQWGIDNNKSGITTETNILTLKNATTYNGVTNRGLIRLTSLSVSSSAASGVGAFRIKINAALGGTPVFTAINGSSAGNGVVISSGNSVASYDTAGTTVSGGTLVFTIYVDNPDTHFIDLTPYDIFIAPGDTATISGFSSISAQMGVGINWAEDI